MSNTQHHVSFYDYHNCNLTSFIISIASYAKTDPLVHDYSTRLETIPQVCFGVVLFIQLVALTNWCCRCCLEQCCYKYERKCCCVRVTATCNWDLIWVRKQFILISWNHCSLPQGLTTLMKQYKVKVESFNSMALPIRLRYIFYLFMARLYVTWFTTFRPFWTPYFPSFNAISSWVAWKFIGFDWDYNLI